MVPVGRYTAGGIAYNIPWYQVPGKAFASSVAVCGVGSVAAILPVSLVIN